MPLLRRLGAEIPWHSQTSSPSLPSVVASDHAWSYSLSLRVHASMTVFGVVRVFLVKTSKITTASESRRYNDSPVRLRVAHSQFMTTGTHNGHRPRLRHAHRLPLLQQAQQITGLHPGRPGKGRGLDLSVKPGERLVARAHGDHPMSNPTCSQMVASILRITPACSRRPPAAVDTDVSQTIRRIAEGRLRRRADRGECSR